GIRPSARRRVTIADTRFGRIAVAICRDFLDLDLRVELKNADPPVDIVLNPAFTPVTPISKRLTSKRAARFTPAAFSATPPALAAPSSLRRRNRTAAAALSPAAKRSSSRTWTSSPYALLVATGKPSAAPTPTSSRAPADIWATPPRHPSHPGGVLILIR